MLHPDDRREMVDKIDPRHETVDQFDVEHRVVNVVKSRIVEQVSHLGDRTRVEHENFVAARDERVGKMRPQKPRAAGYQNPHVTSELLKQYRSIAAPVATQHLARDFLGTAFELRTFHDHTALARRDFNCAARGFSNYFARRSAACGFRPDARFPYQQLSSPCETERARIRMRHGPHQVEYPARRPLPVYPSVLRFSASEVTSLRDIHLSPRRISGDDLRMHFIY